MHTAEPHKWSHLWHTESLWPHTTRQCFYGTILHTTASDEACHKFFCHLESNREQPQYASVLSWRHTGVQYVPADYYMFYITVTYNLDIVQSYLCAYGLYIITTELEIKSITFCPYETLFEFCTTSVGPKIEH